jgi:hypothetical protein
MTIHSQSKVDAPISVAALLAAMTTKAAKRNPQIAVAAWNNAVSVGTWVEYRSVIGVSEPKRFKTQTPAQMVCGPKAVVWLEGKSGCVLCTHCTPVVEEGGAA